MRPQAVIYRLVMIYSMGAKVSRVDFEWVSTDDYHTVRRRLILEKYPQMKELYGHDRLFKWVVAALVTVQLLSLPLIQHLSWPTLLLLAYCFGGVINHSLMASLHDIAHSMAFGANRPLANELFGIFANVPIGVPMAITFKKYHKSHHKYFGVDGLDPDLPTSVEAKMFSTAGGKLMWFFLYPAIYMFRPLIVQPMRVTPMELINAIIQIFFNAVVVKLYGWKVVAYLVTGSAMTLGVHPVATHLIAEHLMSRKGFETNSYYGPLNWILFNVGYHNEHHDFPAVPSSKLPQVRHIASELYDNLPQQKSFSKLLYDFVMNPELGPHARIKRKQNKAINLVK